MERETHPPTVTLGISIPIDMSKQNKSHSFARKELPDVSSSFDPTTVDRNIFVNLPPSLDPNLGIMGKLLSSNMEYNTNTFNAWNIQPHFLKTLPVSKTSDFSESSILVFGGLNPSSVLQKNPPDFDHDNLVLGSTVFQYLLGSRLWKYYGTMIEPKCYHACALNGKYVYITGGYSLLKREHGEMLATSSTDRLDVTKKEWVRCANMVIARASHAVVSHKEYLYAFGGRSYQGRILSSVEMYNPHADIWTEISSIPQPCMGLSATCTADGIWLVGGITTEDIDISKSLLSNVFLFIPSGFGAGRWYTGAPLPYPCAFSSCISNCNSLWLIGGCTSNNSKKNLISCSYISQLKLSEYPHRWKLVESLQYPRHALTAVLYEEFIYILAGIESGNNCASNKMEVFNTALNICTEFQYSYAPESIAGCTSVLIHEEIVNYKCTDGKIYTFSNLSQENYLNMENSDYSSESCEIFSTSEDICQEHEYDDKSDIQTIKTSDLSERGSDLNNIENNYFNSEVCNTFSASEDICKEDKHDDENHIQVIKSPSGFYERENDLNNMEDYDSTSEICKTVSTDEDICQVNKCDEKSHIQAIETLSDLSERENALNNNMEDNEVYDTFSAPEAICQDKHSSSVSVTNKIETKSSKEAIFENINVEDSLFHKSIEETSTNHEDFNGKDNLCSNLYFDYSDGKTVSDLCRASMEIVLKPDRDDNTDSSDFQKFKSSAATKWLNYFKIMSISDEKLHKQYFQLSKPNLNVTTEIRGNELQENFQSTEVKYIEKESCVINENPSNTYTSVQDSAPSYDKSFMFVQSNTKSQKLPTESNAKKFKKKNSEESLFKRDILPAGLYDSGKIMALNEEYFPIILVAGGEYQGSIKEKSRYILSYNCANNIWRFVGYMPDWRCHHRIVFLSNKIYVIGGFKSKDSRRCENITNKTLCYDIYKETWHYIADMNYSRAFHCAVVFKNEIYVLGGRDQLDEILTSVEVYNESIDEWRECKSLPYPVFGAAVTVISGKFYMCGGITYKDENKMNELISFGMLVFNPENNCWSAGPDLPMPLAFCGISTVSNSVWLFGGLTEEGRNIVSTKDILKWDAVTRIWSKVAELSIARHASVTVSLGNTVFVIGGHSSQSKREEIICEKIDISKNEILDQKSVLLPIPGRAGVLITEFSKSDSKII